MHDLNDLRLFVQVAQAQSYAAASKLTAIPRATISRRIAAFEAALGQRLIERSSRSFRLTAAGRSLLAKAAPLIAAAERAFDAATPEDGPPQGMIHFAVPPSLWQLHLDDMVANYLFEFPQVHLQVAATNRRLDLLREEFDFVIRAGNPGIGPADHVVLPLAHVDHLLALAPVWTPAIRPSLAATLTQVPALVWGRPHAPSAWRLWDTQGDELELTPTPRLLIEDMAALRKAALRGLGMALLPEVMIREDLAAGRLIAPAFDLRAPQGRIHALHTGAIGMRPVVRHFLDWLARAYATTCKTTITAPKPELHKPKRD